MQRIRRNAAILATQRLGLFENPINSSEDSSSSDDNFEDSEDEFDEIVEDAVRENEDDSLEEDNNLGLPVHNVNNHGDDRFISKDGEEVWMREPVENPNAGSYFVFHHYS